MDNKQIVAVMTHNPKGEWGDVRPQIERGSYNGWGKSLSVDVGQKVLIYISGDIRQIQYVMKVEKINSDKTIDLTLIEKLDHEESKALSYENLSKHGLKQGTINYILNNNEELFDYVNSILNQNTINRRKMRIKNIILYGAPGVGKTHNYKRLISMIEAEENQNTIFQTITQNENTSGSDYPAFESAKKEKRVEFVTFHQSYSYEDFIEGYRPQESGNIELEDGIFKRFCTNANINLVASDKPSHILFHNALNALLQEKIENEEVVRIKLKRKESYFNITSYNDKTIFFEKQNGDTSHSLSIKTLERMYYEETNNIIIGGLAPYYNPLLEKLLEIKKQSENQKTEQKNFYIVIDEINRGNISKIFGELITLIEEDKRDTYEVTLPYSKEKFSIPSNLYIIATMNSTDKSIATIDIALRRRFTFLKMQPNPDLVTNPQAKEFMQKLNKYIKDKRGEDYMLGHSYFMGDDVDIEFITEYKIKPLLEEYFYAEGKTPEKIINEAMEKTDAY
jgi:5-methylcytosine-specific restriction protein B